MRWGEFLIIFNLSLMASREADSKRYVALLILNSQLLISILTFMYQNMSGQIT